MRSAVNVAVALDAKRHRDAGLPFARGARRGDSFTMSTAPGPSGRALSFVAAAKARTDHARRTEAKTRGRSRKAAVRAQRHPPQRDPKSRRARRPAREQRIQGRARAAAVRAGAARPASRAVEQALVDRSVADSQRIASASARRSCVEDQKTGAKETYDLVFGDALEFEEGQVTMASPIGRALLGKAVGEVAFLRLPTMVRQLKVVELTTIHDAGRANGGASSPPRSRARRRGTDSTFDRRA